MTTIENVDYAEGTEDSVNGSAGYVAKTREGPRVAADLAAKWVPFSQDRAETYRHIGYWSSQTLSQKFDAWVAAFSGRVALEDEGGRLTYAELGAMVERCAAGLQALGLTRGDRILIQLPNCRAFVVSVFAAMRMGAVPVFVLPAQRKMDVEGICKVAEPRAMIVQDSHLGFDYRPMARALRVQNPCLDHVIVTGEAEEFQSFDALLAQGESGLTDRQGWPEIAAKEIACLLLSGGTTGTPKLIPRSHADYGYNAEASAALCGLTQESIYLAALPAAHNFTFACPGILGVLSVGGKVVLAQTPSPDECFGLIESKEVTCTSLVPALVEAWLAQRQFDDSNLSSLRLLQVGGAQLSEALARRVGPELGVTLQQVFGMAEGLLCYTRLDDPEEVVQCSQGRPLSQADELRVVDGQGRPVAAGDVGELLVRGPYTINGYFNAAAHNRLAFSDEGYYRSGDLVRRDEMGNITVVGRIKEQINRAGEKIAADEIANQVLLYPGIEGAVALGVPDAELGERIRVVVICNQGPVALRELRAFLRERGVSEYKLPDEVREVSAWPLTAVGKIDKRQLTKLTDEAPAQADSQALELTFQSRSVGISSHPRAVAAHLATNNAEQSAIVYERAGEWSVGIGALLTLSMTSGGVDLIRDGRIAQHISETPLMRLDHILADQGITGWRAYGQAKFELCRHLHGLDLPDEADLLSLAIPQYDCRLTVGQAVLRATTQGDLDRLERQITDLDEALQAATAATEAPEQAACIEHQPPGFIHANGETYQGGVAQAVSEIQRGDYQKVIISRKAEVQGKIDFPASYIFAANRNNQVRSFLILSERFKASGFSPETVVEVDAAGNVSTQPLAGTRARGPDEALNRTLAAELLSDTKEIAEHAVSVQVAFEELRLCCDPGSISVSEFMQVKPRGSVQHLASRVGGRLGDGKNRWDAFAALFPAVTASGCPKREAIDAIGRLEEGPRGLYSGCVLIADEDGALDAALVLRSFYEADGHGWLQAGAGIVDQSTPERELTETIEKMTGVSKSIVFQTDEKSQAKPEAGQ
ncbi:salicylate synthase [Pseudophaeobacter sp.]|uniref:salicylate synthase n=1 Tax=Pseudophaeobacter sp. TaxID=1971739 RepID=UPI0040595395